jgi:hypothetical protein
MLTNTWTDIFQGIHVKMHICKHIHVRVCETNEITVTNLTYIYITTWTRASG